MWLLLLVMKPSAGQAYEAMNNAGHLDSEVIVILNENKQVSLPTGTFDWPTPPVGALSSALSRLQSNKLLRELREVAKVRNRPHAYNYEETLVQSLVQTASGKGFSGLGASMHELAARVDKYARGMISGSGSPLFEELGLYYIGPVDDHNMDDLVAILK